MGSADIIPGVSGGTVALITGIYDDLIFAIRSIDPRFLIYPFLALRRRDYMKRARESFDSIDFHFLIPLIIGIAIAFLVLAQIIHSLITNYPFLVYAFFLGLILSSAIVLYIRMEEKKLFHLLLGIVLSSLFLSLSSIQLNHSLPVIFISGVVSICAMILPGISGAFILLLLGQYDYMLNAITNFSVKPIIVYLIGAVIGILAFSRVLSFLIKKYRAPTLSLLIGVMIGGLKRPLDGLMGSPLSLTTIISVVAGVLLVFGVEYLRRGDRWMQK
jgi:putative membrane protein